MQSFAWYVSRLRSMGAAELGWRLCSLFRDHVDRVRVAAGAFPPAPSVLRAAGAFSPGFRVCDIEPGAWRTERAREDEAAWCARLIERADKIVEHRLTFFDLRDHFLGSPIAWNRDHGSDKPSPVGYAHAIDYRDFSATGDCKLVWEPNRHLHLVVLGRAYRASGDHRYAVAVVEQLNSWLEQCPYGTGMNWRSPLEQGVRLINWVWALDMIWESGAVEVGFRERIIHSAYLHLWDVTRRYSQGSSANNHLVGEAAGVFVAASYFPWLPNAGRWAAEAKMVLARELLAQSYADGCTKEHALGYQLFVLQFYLVAGVVARKVGNDFLPEYWDRLGTMMEFVGLLLEGGPLPLFGDNDDGYVLDLGTDHPRDPEDLLAAGAVCLERIDLRSWSGGYREFARWLLGAESRDAFDTIARAPSSKRLESKAFADSGYYLLQGGAVESSERVSVFFDCADLGYGNIAAHGHADALSIALRVGGEDVLVDPGTYDYFTHSEWRRYFRTTSAHNTVELDGQDQSVILGPFLWGHRARARCLSWEPGREGGRVRGEHDGYRRLIGRAIHRREVQLAVDERTLWIKDEIDSSGSHLVVLRFHLAEGVTVERISDHVFRVVLPRGRVVTLEVDQKLTVDLIIAATEPILGWISRSYHAKSATVTVLCSGTCEGRGSYSTRILWDQLEQDQRLVGSALELSESQNVGGVTSG